MVEAFVVNANYTIAAVSDVLRVVVTSRVYQIIALSFVIYIIKQIINKY